MELARTTAPSIADIGSSFYFRPETLAAGKEHGLDGFRFYFLGRGGVLGDVEPDVVRSAFGYFHSGLIAKMWNTAKERMAPREAARVYIECNHDLGRRQLGDVDGLEAFCDAAASVNEAIDPTGLALYAGVGAEAVPDDAPARAMHLAMCLREARGSAHLAAIRVSGLDPEVAHFIKRGPEDWKFFGHQADDAPEVTAEDRRALDDAEATTDAMMAPAFGVLDETGAAALVTGLEAIHAAIWPGDPRNT